MESVAKLYAVHGEIMNLVRRLLEQETVKLKPDDAEAKYHLALVYSLEKKFQQALVLLHGLVKMINALSYQIGIIHLMKEDFGSAVEYLRAALALEPENERDIARAFKINGRS